MLQPAQDLERICSTSRESVRLGHIGQNSASLSTGSFRFFKPGNRFAVFAVSQVGGSEIQQGRNVFRIHFQSLRVLINGPIEFAALVINPTMDGSNDQ